MARDLTWNKIMLNEFRKLAILTEDEDKVLSGWSRNKSIVEIALTYGMTERTVSRHLERIRGKYDEVQKFTPLLPARRK